jgi:hypothetical protein
MYLPNINKLFFLLLDFIILKSTNSNFDYVSGATNTCVVIPGGSGSDDAPAILEAFRKCGRNGRVEFLNETYHIESVMNTTELRKCHIDLKGTLLVCLSICPFASGCEI